MKQFVQNEEAVSPVIGVILMVAITVILAAVIAAFVFGMTGNMPTATKNVVVQANLNVTGGANDAIDIRIMGGTTADIKDIKSFKITAEDGSGATIALAQNVGLDAPTNDVFDVTNLASLGVGEKYSVIASAGVTESADGPITVTVTAIFSDGSEQMVVSPTKI